MFVNHKTARLPETWNVGESGEAVAPSWSPADYVKLLNINTAKVSIYLVTRWNLENL